MKNPKKNSWGFFIGFKVTVNVALITSFIQIDNQRTLPITWQFEFNDSFLSKHICIFMEITLCTSFFLVKQRTFIIEKWKKSMNTKNYIKSESAFFASSIANSLITYKIQIDFSKCLEWQHFFGNDSFHYTQTCFYSILNYLVDILNL